MICSNCKREGHNKRSCKNATVPVLSPNIEVKTDVNNESESETESEQDVEEEVKSDENDEPWEHILKFSNYKGESEFYITAKQMKECRKTHKGKASQFEPRLLAYQTSANARPSILKIHGLSILPIENGKYVLLKAKIYKELDYSCSDIITIKKDESSLILNIGNSETSLIDNLRYSGVFERPEILGESITHGPLLNGRHRCSMEMKIGTMSIKISSVQYETDGCYESKNKVLLIEGKSSPSMIDSFNIRQLYFPYREIIKVAVKKEVVCLFIHNLKDNIHIWKYSFTDINQFDSIRLDGHYIYKFSL